MSSEKEDETGSEFTRSLNYLNKNFDNWLGYKLRRSRR